MATIAIVSVAGLALLVFVLFGALIELYRDVRQLRDIAGILDRPLNVDISPVAGTSPSIYGLPRMLDTTASAIVLFLSEKCSTCRSLAASFGKELPAGIWVILEANTAESGQAFLESFGLMHLKRDGRVSVDLDGKIAAQIGLDTTPVGFHIENGVFVRATTIPSTRYLSSVLPTPIQLTPKLT